VTSKNKKPSGKGYQRRKKKTRSRLGAFLPQKSLKDPDNGRGLEERRKGGWGANRAKNRSRKRLRKEQGALVDLEKMQEEKTKGNT